MSQQQHAPHFLLIGNADFADFQAGFRWLQRRVKVTATPQVDRALALLERGYSPAVTLIAQDRRGRYTQRDVDNLQAAAPLTRIVTWLGSWCEGETRTGTPFRGVPRIYWHQLTAQVSLYLRDPRSSWNQPQTSSANDRWLQKPHPAFPTSGETVGVLARTVADFEGVSEVCDRAGFESVWLDRPRNELNDAQYLVSVIWDGLDLKGQQREKLRKVVRTFAGVPVIATIGFPRVYELRKALDMGAAWVVGKPMMEEDLIIPLQRLVSQYQRRAA